MLLLQCSSTIYSTKIEYYNMVKVFVWPHLTKIICRNLHVLVRSKVLTYTVVDCADIEILFASLSTW